MSYTDDELRSNLVRIGAALASGAQPLPSRRCDNCQFWAAGTTDGACKRHAPVLIQLEQDCRTLWPLTNKNDRCGDHRFGNVNEAA